MKKIEIINPQHLVRQGLKSLGRLTNLYADEKSEAKSRAELTFIGKKKMEKVWVQHYAYNEASLKCEEDISAYDFINSSDRSEYHWLNLSGIHEVPQVEKIAAAAGLDRLTIRQILDTTQRPKVEDYDNYLFFSIKSVNPDVRGEGITVENISFILSANFVISFQEERADHFEGIRNKMNNNLGFIRKRSSDYLLVQLLDAIMDNYFETIEVMNENLKQVESIVLTSPQDISLVTLESLKNDAYLVRKSLVPFKDALANIINSRTDFIYKQNFNYYKDILYSASSAIEEVDGTLRTIEGIKNIYFASLSQKMNETMKVLTIVATIFIPLTFIAGIYGMNFAHIPELQYRYGYFVVWGVMVVITGGMVYYFRKNKWI